MRTTILCIVLAACSGDAPVDDPIDEPTEDPACAGEDPSTSARAEDPPWDLDRDPAVAVDGDDSLAEPDAIEDDIELLGISLGNEVTPYGLSDPLTSTGKYRTWPNGRIPYKFATTNGVIQVNSATRTALSQAMTNWEQLTEGRIKFRPKQASDSAYVIIRQGSPRVSPFVGYRKDQVSNIYLRDSEYITVIKHELGHVVGLHHEQRRTDRLSYIKVRSQYIVDSDLCRYQFATCSDCKKVGTYDRNSVMHYRTTDLGNCRTGSVLLKLDGSAINHYWKLSPKDLTAVKTMYATAPPPPPPPQPQPQPVLPESGSVVSGATCISVASNSEDPGALLESQKCDGGGDQDWRLTIDGQLRVQHSLQCAAVVGCSVDGAKVEQATCSPAALDQKWTLTEMSLVHASGKCAEATTKLALAACSGSDSQLFTFNTETEAILIDGKCLTAGGTNIGDDITLSECDGSPHQMWFQGRGGFVTRANTARCLRAGTVLEVGECTDAADQRWALRGMIRDARADLCLSAGAPMTLAACDGTATQLWTLWSR